MILHRDDAVIQRFIQMSCDIIRFLCKTPPITLCESRVWGGGENIMFRLVGVLGLMAVVPCPSSRRAAALAKRDIQSLFFSPVFNLVGEGREIKD